MKKEGKVPMALLKRQRMRPQGVVTNRANGRYSMAPVSRLGLLSLDLLPESRVIPIGDVAASAIRSVGAVVVKVESRAKQLAHGAVDFSGVAASEFIDADQKRNSRTKRC